MLNKLWAGLIIVSILFALGSDLMDEIDNRHANGKVFNVDYVKQDDKHIEFVFQQYPVVARIDRQQVNIIIDSHSPPQLQTRARYQPGQQHDLIRARLIKHNPQTRQLSLALPDIHWIKLQSIAAAGFDMAEFAVKLAIGLAGIMALWLGLMQIAEHSGMIHIFVRLVQPLLGKLFPQVPAQHPALGSISLNMAANILGLGNAATPLGIKAMQQLQQLNEHKHRASDAMCMFLAINTSSVQLLPPVTLIALMGTQVSELIVPIILATTCSTLAAVTAVKFFTFRGRP